MRFAGRIIHLTSVHPRSDVRIFLKECRSLARAGYDVSLVVADGKGDEARDGVILFDVGDSNGRLHRMWRSTSRILAKAFKLNTDIYHLHDPELIPVGLLLKKAGKKVIFDSHEDVPKQLLSKPYLNRTALRVIGFFYEAFERMSVPRFDGVIAATPHIRKKFEKINPKTVAVQNFPLLDELDTDPTCKQKEQEVCYIGGLSRIRGLVEMVLAMAQVKYPVRLNLCGDWEDPRLEQACKANPGWARIVEHGFVGRQRVKEVLRRSLGGLVCLHPTINYVVALPVKMFEYMAAGIPVIASDFPLWKEIVEGNGCGICVDPLNPKQIADAIDYLATHPEEASRMGANGRNAVIERYNWNIEETKLLAFYEKILSS